MKKGGCLVGHTRSVFAVKFSNNSKYAMSGGDERVIKLWNVNERKHVKDYQSPCREVIDILISNDNGNFTVCGNDKDIYTIDVLNNDIVRKLHGHTMKINTICYNEHQNIIISGGDDMMTMAHDIQTNKVLCTMKEAKDSITKVITNDMNIYTTSADGCLRIYDIRNGLYKFDNFKQPLSSISIINNELLCLSTINNELLIYNQLNQKIIKRLHTYNNKLKIKLCFEWR